MKEKVQRYREILGKASMLYQVSEKLAARDNADANEEINLSRKTAALYVMAPVMCSYVAWVLKKACEAGRRRLYFLARDGYSMYETARIFCEKMELPIECRYLYCSRYAWRKAEYHLLKEDSLAYICLGGIDVSFQKLMSRAGLEEREGREIAGLLGREREYETPLNYRQLRELQKLLWDCGSFTEKMFQKSRDCYPLVTGYLKQEGLLDPVPWALVDSGWTGSMQKSLQHLLNSMGYEGRAEGYYFGMYEYPREADRDAYHCFYFSPAEGLLRKTYFSNSLFECIFSSPEGMTVGYEKRGESYEVLLEKRWNPNRERIEQTTEYLKRYGEELAEQEGKDFLSENVQDKKIRRIVFSLLREFMGKPALQEAEEFGSYIFCDDVIGEGNQKVAAELTSAQIRENRILHKILLRLRKKGSAVRESAWLEGSILCSGMSGRELRHCALGKYILYLRKQFRNYCSNIKCRNMQ